VGKKLALEDIRRFLHQLGTIYNKSARLYLLGGSALSVLGHPRRTLDIDLAAGSLPPDLIDAIKTLEKALEIEVEFVPIEEFIPLPGQAETRHIQVMAVGELEIFIFDPYSIALSKLARGFEADIQDVVFMLNERVVALETLSDFVKDALPKAWDFDIDPADLEKYFKEVKRLLN
jgi:hypothetical protein